jgi:nitrite reductase/ring-hydroxylating ferredoxin subunit
MSETRLCELAELSDPGSRGFEIPLAEGEQPLLMFVVRKGDQVYGYRNSCPHTGAPLEWLPDQFLDRDNSFIECALHGALFDLAEGRCLRGPCVGDSLQRLAVSVRDGVVWLASPVPLEAEGA